MHSTETEKEHVGVQGQTEKSRLDKELEDLNHVQELISEDMTKIVANEKK